MNDEEMEQALRPLRGLPGVPPERRAAAFERVRAEWQAELATRQIAAEGPRRSRRLFALAASVLLVLFAGVMIRFGGTPTSPAQVATVSAVHGNGPFRIADPVLSGQRIETGTSTLAATLPSGLVVRLAPGSTLAFTDRGHLELEHGRVFVDSGTARTPDPLIVRTALGDIRHLGTQYLVDIDGGRLAVAVREGVIALQRPRETTPLATAAAGEQLTVSTATAAGIERGAVAAHDASWRWIEAVPAALDVEGLSLTAFMQWYRRETGRTVKLENIDPDTRLHGSIAGLTPDDALDAIAVAVEFQVLRENGSVVVRRR
jgi:ferric-dicitrate binding protein FerR (iron transport regulator)